MKIIVFLGYKNSGKTTALTSIAREIGKRQWGKVGTIKHIHESKYAIDPKGKDSWLHAATGAAVVLTVTSTHLTIIRKTEPGGMKNVVRLLLPVFSRERVRFLLVEGFYQSFAKRRGARLVLCASSEREVRKLLREHGSQKVLCITGKIAELSDRGGYKEIQDLPVFRVPKDSGKILDLIGK